MTLEDLDLPYEYTDNTRAGTVAFAVGSVFLTAVLTAVSFFIYALPVWLIAAPIAAVIVRAFLFSVIRNGVHEAIRDADLDRRLDEWVNEEIERRTGPTSILNPTIFAQRLAEEEEGD